MFQNVFITILPTRQTHKHFKNVKNSKEFVVVIYLFCTLMLSLIYFTLINYDEQFLLVKVIDKVIPYDIAHLFLNDFGKK